MPGIEPDIYVFREVGAQSRELSVKTITVYGIFPKIIYVLLANKMVDNDRNFIFKRGKPTEITDSTYLPKS